MLSTEKWSDRANGPNSKTVQEGECRQAQHDLSLAMLIYGATCTPLSNSIP